MTIKAMVIEDSDVMRFLLTNFLKECNVEVICETANGDEAIEIYKQKKPDLIFLDLIIQGKKGMDVLKELHQINPGINVVICSSLGDEHHIKEAAEIGIFDYLVKPMSIIQLKEVIDHYSNIINHSRTRKKVLIADDSQLTRGMITRITNLSGYEVIGEAANGNELIKMNEKLNPDIIIVDLVMPEKGGIMAIKEIREKNKEVKIIVSTSLAGVEFMKESMLAGANDIILKPFTKMQFKKVLDNHQ